MTKIKDIPYLDRPIERLINKGSDSLSNEELLAILLRTGNKLESSKDLAIKLLSKVDNLEELSNLTLEQLKSIKGIGNSKAAILLASFELSKRLNQKVDTINNKRFHHPKLIFDYYKNIIGSKSQEYFYAIYLDTSKK